jgi:hypothetical protein
MFFDRQSQQTNLPSASLNREYPAPPSVPWWLLLLAFAAWSTLIQTFVRGPYQLLLKSIPAAAWAFYLCQWIRSLESNARSPFWCDVAVIVELAYSALQIRQNSSPAIEATSQLLGIASSILGLVTIFLIRSDLERHYNEHEHTIGLHLSGAMTFFFSFLYFQYHLREIALLKKNLAQESLSGVAR